MFHITKKMSFADKLSVSRIFLIPVFVFLLVGYSRFDLDYLRLAAVLVFFIAVLTDFFDGLVARIKQEKSDIGKIIDPLADKLLLVISFITLYFLNEFNMPWWVVLVVISRDLIILVGVFVLNFLKTDTPIVPSVWGKLTTFFQMLTILSVLLDLAFSPYIYKTAVLFTIISGIGYIIRGLRVINVVDSAGK